MTRANRDGSARVAKSGSIGSHLRSRFLGAGVGLCLVAGVGAALTWFVDEHGSAATALKGSVMSVHAAAGTFTVKPANQEPRHGRLSQTRAGSPSINCPPPPPAILGVTIDIAPSTQFERCTANGCSPAAFVDLTAREAVVVTGTIRRGQSAPSINPRTRVAATPQDLRMPTRRQETSGDSIDQRRPQLLPRREATLPWSLICLAPTGAAPLGSRTHEPPGKWPPC